MNLVEKINHIRKPIRWQLDDGREIVPLNTGYVAKGVKYVPVLLGDGSTVNVRMDRIQGV